MPRAAWHPTIPCLPYPAASALQVAVTGGNFRDFEGKVVQASGGRLIADLDIFGKQTRVELSPSDVSRADSSGGGSGGGDGGDGSVWGADA